MAMMLRVGAQRSASIEASDGAELLLARLCLREALDNNNSDQRLHDAETHLLRLASRVGNDRSIAREVRVITVFCKKTHANFVFLFRCNWNWQVFMLVSAMLRVVMPLPNNIFNCATTT
jgi:hypothetical protein